jgi:hypothetical protein
MLLLIHRKNTKYCFQCHDGGDTKLIDVVLLFDDFRVLTNFTVIFCLIFFQSLYEHKNPKQINTPGREFIISNIIHDQS